MRSFPPFGADGAQPRQYREESHGWNDSRSSFPIGYT